PWRPSRVRDFVDCTVCNPASRSHSGMVRLPESCDPKPTGGLLMGGFSIYFLFLAALLFAAPRRLPNYAMIAVIAVTAFCLHRDFVALNVAQQTSQEPSISDAGTLISQVYDAVRLAVAAIP